MAKNLSHNNKLLKNYILDRVSKGKSVKEACQELEQEKKQNKTINYMKWVLFIRNNCKEEYEQAIEAHYVNLLASYNHQMNGNPMSILSHNAHQPIEEDVKMNNDETTERTENLHTEEEHQNELTGSKRSNDIVNINDKDKISLDLLLAVEQIIKDRQFTKLTLDEQKQKLTYSYENNEKLKRDMNSLEQRILEKDRELDNTEQKLTNKQMNFDQLLEDFKELQVSTASEIEDLQYKVEMGLNKYNKLNEEANEYRITSMKETEVLQEKVRELRVQNEQLHAQYKNEVVQKSKLLNTINDFTDHLSSSLHKEKHNDHEEVQQQAKPGISLVENEKHKNTN